MIRVARSRSKAVEAALAAQGKDGLSEAERAIWFHLGTPPARPLPPGATRPTKLKDFEAYKSPPVKQALAKMFGRRCAYCEGRYASTSPMDVEHYRPKNGYLDAKGKLVPPGYYWLAASWTNLLPSCIDCNRVRGQVLNQSGKVVEAKSGKGNHFPVAVDSPRLTGPGCCDNEIPLLLDPCRDRPELHLHFSLDGFVRPADTPQEKSLPKGLETINVCGLDRNELVGERCGHSLYIRGAIKGICAWERRVRQHPGDASYVADRDAAEQELAERLADTPKYLALTNKLRQIFATMRAAATAYHVAFDAWKSAPASAVTQANLDVEMARIKQLPEMNGPYAAFARDILVWLDAAPPSDA